MICERSQAVDHWVSPFATDNEIECASREVTSKNHLIMFPFDGLDLTTYHAGRLQSS